MAADSPASAASRLVIPAEASLLPNQAIHEPPKDAHYLSAADDLVGRFRLEDSYHVLLHPFRKDLHKSKRPLAGDGEDGDEDEVKPQIAKEAQSRLADAQKEDPAASTSDSPPPPANLARSYEHFLPPFLPGRIRPMKPPRKRQTINRRQALQNIAESQQAGSGGEAQIKNRDRELAKKDEEWEKFKQTLRRVVYKPEYTPADIRPLEDDAMKGFRVQAGEVEEIDRSLLEADPPPGSVQIRKKKKKAPGGAATPLARSHNNGGGPGS